MAGFTLNRQMTFILALIATLAMSPAVNRPAHADGVRTGPGDPTSPNDPGYSGDPDYPVGNRKYNRSGNRNQGAAIVSSRSVGDGRSVDMDSVLMWRLRVVLLRNFRAYFLRY
jgi:hypothetical protein